MKSRITRALTIMLIFFSLCGLAACELPIPRQFTKEYREAFNKAPIVEATVTNKDTDDVQYIAYYNKVGSVNVPVYQTITNYYIIAKYNNKEYKVKVTSSYFNKVSLNDKIQLKYFEDKMYVE